MSVCACGQSLARAKQRIEQAEARGYKGLSETLEDQKLTPTFLRTGTPAQPLIQASAQGWWAAALNRQHEGQADIPWLARLTPACSNVGSFVFVCRSGRLADTGRIASPVSAPPPSAPPPSAQLTAPHEQQPQTSRGGRPAHAPSLMTDSRCMCCVVLCFGDCSGTDASTTAATTLTGSITSLRNLGKYARHARGRAGRGEWGKTHCPPTARWMSFVSVFVCVCVCDCVVDRVVRHVRD